MLKTGMGRELKMKALHVDRVPLTLMIIYLGKCQIFVQHIFYVCHFPFAFYHEVCVYRPAKSPDLGRRLSAFSLHCRLSGFEVHLTGEIENLLAFFSDRLFYYLR